jgi:hypothetical protein
MTCEARTIAGPVRAHPVERKLIVLLIAISMLLLGVALGVERTAAQLALPAVLLLILGAGFVNWLTSCSRVAHELLKLVW